MANLICKWTNKDTHCARSDGRTCTINATRYRGRKGYRVRVWDRGTDIRSLDAELMRSKAAAKSWCLYAAQNGRR